MRYRKLDGSGDYTLGKRGNVLSGADAVVQAIYTRLNLLLGEWWENVEDGLPLFQKFVGVYKFDQDNADLIIADRIQGTTGVLGIESFESTFDPSARTYTASCSVNTMFGAIKVSIGSGEPTTQFISLKAFGKELV